ncbi:Ephexin-1 [Operophtera brumata]|uniref:Ephexin-1 n=1 Tax=Operophtera brumata TaxID=104452 RepID=A0A0L7L7X1_OPEBR|nr:Ephexin-1 [Operophtera brumata]
MEGEVTNTGLISSIKHFNIDGKQHGTINTLLKNFILPEPDMAIKQNQNDKCVYTVPMKLPLPNMTARTKSINEAKLAFLNSTVSPPTRTPRTNDRKKEESTIHYAQLAVTTESDDPRSTGGGKDKKEHAFSLKTNNIANPVNISSSPKNKCEQHHQQRKVSFKTKSASVCYRRPPIATKTMTVTSTNVSELTKKFNNLQNESHDSASIPPKLVKTIEDLTTATCSASNSSTPSSTLSSSSNIKIILRQRRGSKKRYNRKRCSSMDSIDKLALKDNTSTKILVIRSKSDGTKIPKSSKKRLKYHDSSEQQSGSDSVDGSPVKPKNPETKEPNKPPETVKVKNVIKKFECEISAQTNTNNTLKRQPDRMKSATPIKEKPKVPEKKSSLVLTKNVVVKDGVAKLRTIKPPVVESAPKNNNKPIPIVEATKKRETIYDRKKYKTNYIHTEKMPLKVVEIIPEDINESTSSISSEQNISVSESSYCTKSNEVTVNEEVNSQITPNDSFLWRRKSTTQIYADPEQLPSESPYCFINSSMDQAETSDHQLGSNAISINEVKITANEETQVNDCKGSQTSNTKCDSNMDFESNLVEAYNKEVLVGFTAKPKEEPEEENDYEPLDMKDNNHVVIIPVKSVEGPKVNCPLPEIPKLVPGPETSDEEKDNIYQCLIEMRSHPEGDESSLHNYEVCENALEERTRGDGDSDDGYEYCKAPIKPYCHTSSAGIQIAEDYKPYSPTNPKNYIISKSVSGTSTVSYEKIGSERIYEKIPNLSPKSKDSSPTYSSRHSFISDYTSYNDNENIYDTIKHGDGASLSHCYESIPNSPSIVKFRNNVKKNSNSAVHKRLSFDTVSNISQLTMSSEQKTNSIYGQRSVISYNGQEMTFQVPSSETSVSDRSDRSDDWVDVSDEEKSDEQKIIIVRERSRGRKSPISWSQKVRHQWQKTPKKNDDKG